MSKNIVLCSIFTLLCLALWGESAPCETLLHDKGALQDVELLEWNSKKESFCFRRFESETELKIEQFLAWGAPVEPSPAATQLILLSGGVHVGTLVEVQNETIVLETEFLGTLSFPLDSVAAILFPNASKHVRNSLAENALHAPNDDDRLCFRTKEFLDGFVEKFENGECFFRNQDGTTLRIPQSRLAALSFSGKLRSLFPETHRHRFFWLGLRDGSLFPLLLDDPNWKAKLDPLDLATIVYIETPNRAQDFFDAALTSATAISRTPQWLDEIPPDATTPAAPFGESGLIWTPRINQNHLGERIRVQNRIIRRGIGMPAGSSMRWTLDSRGGNFCVLIAMNDSPDGGSPNGACVVFRVKTDGQLQAEVALSADDAPRFIEVDVSNAHELEISTSLEEENSNGTRDNPTPISPVWLYPFLTH
ncbi:MAG: NPCBM/NEW2 domain-containing protein [Planctomycetia bacterium]|nr:NPCBM/NEW2 domain-containing protein [Planctomycetia bacterium]